MHADGKSTLSSAPKWSSGKVNFQTKTVIMLTSAENAGYSEVLIFIFELLSEVNSDCHEIL